MRAFVLVLATCLVTVALAGCVDQGSPRLETSLARDTLQWGGAAQLTVRNTGDGPAPAPVELRVRSANGTVVRTFEDITGGNGIPVNGQVSVSWAGLNDEDRPVLWGTYHMEVPAYALSERVELERPPHHAITVDAIPSEAEAGSAMAFRVNNTGTTWVNGSMQVAAGRDETVLYTAEVDVRMPPGTGRSFFWGGKAPDGSTPEAQKYLIAVRVEPLDGPTPFAQDVFTLT